MKALKKFLHDFGMEIGSDIKAELEEDDELSESVIEDCKDWISLFKFCECYAKMKHGSHHSVHVSDKNGEHWLVESIEDELEGAEGYYGRWSDTGNEVYKTLAREELSHGESLMTEAAKGGIDVDGFAQLFGELRTKLAK